MENVCADKLNLSRIAVINIDAGISPATVATVSAVQQKPKAEKDK